MSLALSFLIEDSCFLYIIFSLLIIVVWTYIFSTGIIRRECSRSFRVFLGLGGFGDDWVFIVFCLFHLSVACSSSMLDANIISFTFVLLVILACFAFTSLYSCVCKSPFVTSFFVSLLTALLITWLCLSVEKKITNNLWWIFLLGSRLSLTNNMIYFKVLLPNVSKGESLSYSFPPLCMM